MPLLKFANADLLEAQIAVAGGGLMKSAHKAVFNYEPREGYLYVRSRAISNRTNDNYDTWPDDELRQAWSTFIGKPVFVNHHNDDVRRKRGVIIDAALHEDVGPDGRPDIWIEVLMEIDAIRFPKLAEAILNHDIERTSMGADVGESECSYCGNVATTPSTYCAHIKSFKGRRLARRNPDGTEEEVLVHEICIAQGEMVSTLRGLVPIESVVVGDMALTRAGWRRVTDARQTGVRPTVKITLSDGTTLRCTEDHLIATAAGWTPAVSLLVGDVDAEATVSVRAPLAGVHVGVLDGELVTSLAVGLEGMPVIEPVGDGVNQPEMARVDAVALSADVVDFDPLEIMPEKVHHSSVNQSFVVRVATDAPVSIGGSGSLPDQALILGNGSGEQSFQFVQAVCVSHDATVPVYDLTVEGEHEFVANGIVVHNCRKISFFENSVLVEPPADPTAFFLGVDDRGVRSLGMTAKTAKVRDDAYVTLTEEQKERFAGTTVRQDDDGFYCHTHRARGKSYPSIDEIPDDEIGFIESTGAAKPKGALRWTSRQGVEVYDAEHDESVFDPEGGRWAMFCKEHGQVINTQSLELARYFAQHPEEWCEVHMSPDDWEQDSLGSWGPKRLASFETEVQQEMTKMANRKKDRWRTMAKTAAAPQIEVSDSADYQTGFVKWRAEVKVPGFDYESDLPMSVMVEAQQEGTKSWSLRAIFGPHNTKDGRGSYYHDQPLGSFTGTKGEAKAEAVRQLRSIWKGWESGQYRRTAAITTRGTCSRCHEQKALVPPGAICQDCVDAVRRGEPMYDDERRSASKTAGALDYGPTEPGPRAGTRWEGIISTPNSRAYEVTVLWPGDEAPMLSGVFDSEERAREWAQKCVDAGGRDVLIENAGTFTRVSKTASTISWKNDPDSLTASDGFTVNQIAYDGQHALIVYGDPGQTFFWTVEDRNTSDYVADGAAMTLERAKRDAEEAHLKASGGQLGMFGSKESARRGPNGEIMCVQDCGRPATGVYVDDRPGGFGSTYCSACVAEWERKGWGHWKKVEDIPKTSSTKLAWGETKAPPQVNTLGITECPVCGTTNQFDSAGRCMTCGHLPAPEPFREPDLEVAQKVDMRDGWVNPNLLSAPAFVPPADGGAGGEENSDGKQPPTEDADPVQKASSATEVVEGLEGDTMRPAAAIIASQEQQIARLSAENAVLRRRAGLVRTADEENPAQPVPEPAAQAPAQSTDEARAADATTEVTTPGSAITDVAPMTTTDVTTPGAAATDVAPDATLDVTAPVAGGAEMPSYEQSVTLVQPDASGASNGTDRTNAFDEDNSWVQQANAVRARVYATIRLAKLRIQAGLADGDDLVVAQQIEASRPSDDALRTEISTLSAVVQQRVASASSAPRRREAARTAPSLASTGSPIVSTGSTSSFEADPVLW